LKVLVTGATGFIGSHLVDRLLANGEEVTALVRSSADSGKLTERGVRISTGDVRDERAVERAVAGAEVVYHLARAKAHGARPMSEVQAVNIDGTSNVARAGSRSGISRIVYASSAAVYGSRVGPQPVSEDTVLHPDSPYARSKAVSEERLHQHARVPVVIARITSVLGPGGKSWLQVFRSVAHHRLRLVGSGKNRHHPADVSEIVDGLVLCGTMPHASGVYNLAGPEHVAIRDMVTMIASELEVDADIPRPVPAGPVEVYLWASRIVDRIAGLRLPRVDSVRFLTSDRTLDLARATTELGYNPRIGVRGMIARTAQWGRKERLL
jgi:nucleoside-diphosphate-sugar epimerase